MLYERWLNIAANHRRERALFDFGGARRWLTFGELHRLGESHGARVHKSCPGFVWPHGDCLQFVLDVLCAWRESKVICLSESGGIDSAGDKAPSECAVLKSTSASTGGRRWVQFTGKQLAADVDAIVGMMSLHPDHPNIGVISLSHSYGFSNLILPLLLHGIPLIGGVQPLPECVKEAASLANNIILPSVPALWSAWISAGCVPANIRVAISAGAPLPLKLESTVLEHAGIKIHNFYGATECGGIAYDDSNVLRTNESVLGRPLPGRNLTTTSDGRLVVEGDSVGSGYWPTATEELGAGKFESSDLIEIQDGWVHWLGRSSEIINVAGRKVFPAAIESAALKIAGVLAAFAIGVPAANPSKGEEIVLFIQCDRSLGDNQIKLQLQNLMPDWQVPRHLVRLDHIPANSRGKIPKSQLMELWKTHAARG